MVDPDLVRTLSEFNKVKICMPPCDTLQDGRDLVVHLQAECGFPLAYVQRIGGDDPAVLVWRVRDESHAMKGYSVERYHA